MLTYCPVGWLYKLVLMDVFTCMRKVPFSDEQVQMCRHFCKGCMDDHRHNTRSTMRMAFHWWADSGPISYDDDCSELARLFDICTYKIQRGLFNDFA